jgi:putative peptidoglycan lipid II flippase
MSTASPLSCGVDRRIFKATSAVILASVIVKCAATLKECVVAGVYGRSDAMEAFLAAFLIPNLLINLIAESMNQALIPTFIRVRIRDGRQRAEQLLSNSMVYMSGLLLAAWLLMGISARAFFPLVGSGFSTGKLDLSIRLFYVLMPVVLLSGIASNVTAILNSYECFAWPALAQLAMPLTMMAGTLLLHRALGIWALVCATLLGASIHAALVASMARGRGYGFRFHRYRSDEATREVAHQYGSVLLSSLVASGGLLVDQAMAARLPAGSVSALVFATRFVSVAMTLLAGAVSSALVPYFSGMITQRDWRGCRRTLQTWSRIMAAVSLPIALAFIAGAQPLVRFTLQHGAFGPSDTAIVRSVLVMSAIQIPFFVVSRVFYRFVVAMRRTDLVLSCGALNLVLDVVLNLVLMRWLGIAGIALATSLWTISTLAFLWYAANRLLATASKGDAESGPTLSRAEDAGLKQDGVLEVQA